MNVRSPGADPQRAGSPAAGNGTADVYGAQILREVEDVLENLKRLFTGLIGGQHDTAERLYRLEAEVKTLRESQEGTHGRLGRLAGTLDTVRAQLADLGNDEFNRHSELGDEWQRLLERKTRKLVEDAVIRHNPQLSQHYPRRIRAEAQLIRFCAERLIVQEGTGLRALEERLAPQDEPERRELAKLISEAADLHHSARTLKVRPEFDFQVPAVVAPETVRLFSAECRYGRPVELVVIPAYRLGDKKLSLPMVLTAAAAPAAATPRTGGHHGAGGLT